MTESPEQAKYVHSVTNTAQVFRNQLWEMAHELEMSKRKNDRRLGTILLELGYYVGELFLETDGVTCEDNEMVRGDLRTMVNHFWSTD